jgi:NAD(P)-dependent dehydrogenase (short-subunit alcohol dehydrogenase family)
MNNDGRSGGDGSSPLVFPLENEGAQMEIAGKIVVVTGAGSGIGRELAKRFAALGAKHVICADLHEIAVRETAAAIGPNATPFHCDVSIEDDIIALVRTAENIGPVDLFCSNAGIISSDPDFDNAASAPNASWQRSWGVHVMAHVYAARALLPLMMQRRSGYFLNTVSAAGLLSQIGSAVYSTTKHAAIGFAESLAIASKDHGIRVSVLCPQGVATAMTQGAFFSGADVDGVLTAEQCVDAAIEGLKAETFVILPHPKVADYTKLKADNYSRWIGGMVKLRRRIIEGRAVHLAKQAEAADV